MVELFESTKNRKNNKNSVRFNSRRYKIMTYLDSTENKLLMEYCRLNNLAIADVLRAGLKEVLI